VRVVGGHPVQERTDMTRWPTALAIAVLVSTPFVVARQANQAGRVDRVALPADVTFPEGVTYDPAQQVLYTASAATGTVVRVNLETRASETVAPAGVLIPAGSTPAFPAILGMKIDASHRLWIAGGKTGRMFVLDARTGHVLKQVEVPDPSGSLINDVALVGSAAYFTDTQAPTLWRLEAHGETIGDLEPWLNFNHTVLQYDSGANLNGIAVTPDNASLIVAQMGKGLLFRIDLATKAVSAIDTGGADLTGMDGLVLDGHTLYAVRQTAVEIATVQLSSDFSTGTVVSRFKDPALAWPATAAKVGDRLIVVNTQFNTRDAHTETTPFTLASVPLARLTGR
jgi:Cu-Zn family superoxide dismutase